MTAPTESLDGGAMDPAIARVLLRLHESVAQATETAIHELRDLGVDDDDAVGVARIEAAEQGGRVLDVEAPRTSDDHA